MSDESADQLRARAQRGTVRGAGEVWTGATRGATGRGTAARGAWLLPVAAAAAVVVVAGLAAGLEDRGPDLDVAAPATTTTAPAVPTAQPSLPARASSPPQPSPTTTALDEELVPGARRAEELDAPYVACVRRRGFPLESAEVIVAGERGAAYAKTSRDVPAEVHGACLVELGGVDPGTSSYGF